MKLEKYVENPDKLRKIRKVFYLLLVFIVISDFLIHREHVSFIWDAIPGFNSFYGLLSSILLIVFSKSLGHAWLMKEEDYYD